MRFGLRELSILAIFTGVVCVATLVLKIDIPLTYGFFNVGDSMVYVAALLFGPIIGGIAGGVGSSLADVLLGALWYAPGTLVIKGVEGLIVGYLGYKIRPKIGPSSAKWDALGVFFGIGLGATAVYLGFTYYIGIFGNFVIEKLFWVAIALLLGVFIVYFGLRHGPRLNWQIVSVLCGGVEMVLGYYLYETLILPYIVPQWEIIAIAEVPFNIGQAVIGLMIALPIVRTVRRSIPSLRIK